MKIIKQKSGLKLFLTEVAALVLMTGTVNADNIRGGTGQLILNIDHDKMIGHPRMRETPRNSGNFVSYSSFIEQYYDQATANDLKGYELMRLGQDGYQPVASTNNLVFGMNPETVVHPLTTIDPALFPNPEDFRDSFHHYLQNTSMYFDPNDIEGTVNGQIGFGGVLRIGFGDLTSETPDLGFGVQGIGDFSLSYNREKSEWELKSNTGRGNPSGNRGRPPFSLEDVVVEASNGELSISGVMRSTSKSRTTGEFSDGRFVPGEVLGTFSMMAATVAESPVIIDQIMAIKTASWSTVSDRPVRITANARLVQAIHYYNIAAANYRQGKSSIGKKYLKLAMLTVVKFKTTLETAVSKNKFPEAEVLPLLEAVDSLHNDVHFIMENPDAYNG